MHSLISKRQLLPDWAKQEGLTHCFVYNGPSMAPLFRAGDLLFVRPMTLQSVRVGDVVVFYYPDSDNLVVHRVVGMTLNGPVTRGDANSRDDFAPMSAGCLIGRVEAVDCDGVCRSVRGGRPGLWLARWRRARRRAARLVWRAGRRPYRWLRRSGLVARWWRPAVTEVRLRTKYGPLVKYVCGGRTVACWWPQENHFECRKPFDLVLNTSLRMNSKLIPQAGSKPAERQKCEPL